MWLFFCSAIGLVFGLAEGTIVGVTLLGLELDEELCLVLGIDHGINVGLGDILGDEYGDIHDSTSIDIENVSDLGW